MQSRDSFGGAKWSTSEAGSDCSEAPLVLHSRAPLPDTRAALVRGAPMVVGIMASLLAVEALLQRELEWRPLFYGAIAFVTAWSLHLAFASRMKRRLGMEELSSHAFSAFTTLLGLVFSIMLGQTFTYYFRRQSAIQDAAFREISELQRLLDLCLSFLQRRGMLDKSNIPAQLHAKGIRMLEMLSTEAASLAPGGDGLMASTQLISTRRSLQGLLQIMNDLSNDANTKNDPATFAALNAAQHALTSIAEARAVRVSQINADLPQVQFLTINMLGGLLLGSFLLTDLKNDQLEAALFGVIAGVATVLKQVLADLASPFSGSWSVGQAQKAGSDLLRVVKEEIKEASSSASGVGQD